MPYAATVALVLGITTYLGWNLLSTDTLMIVGSAFFVIGFDEHKTWVTGIARALGVAAGMLLGLALAPLVTPGIMTTVVVLGAFFLCFAAEGIHPSAFMFFFTFIVTLGWASLDPAALALNINERLLGEGTGIVIALLAISLLQRIQARQSPPGKPMTH